MRYFRENSRIISRLFINQIGMTIFALILTMAASQAAKDNNLVLVLVSVFSILFYLCLIYNVMWDEGARNIIRINAGRMKKSVAFPFTVALIAASPTLLLVALMALSGLVGYIFDVAFLKNVLDVIYIVIASLHAMYIGLFSWLISLLPAVEMWKDFMAVGLYFLAPLPMILVSAGAYFLGTRNIYLFGERKPKEEKKK